MLLQQLPRLSLAPALFAWRASNHHQLWRDTLCAYRKDRVQMNAATRSFLLSSDATTRRFLAPCCNTPLALEFKGGHWLSLYASLWPSAEAPVAQLRTMVADLPDPGILPDDVPNKPRQSLWFFWKLFFAWAAMGFRSPAIATKGNIDA